MANANKAHAGIRDKVRDEVTYNNNIKNETQRKWKENKAKATNEFILQEMQNVDAGKPASDMVFPQDLSPDQYKALSSWRDSKIAGKDIVTDRNTYYKLTMMAANDPAKFSDIEQTDLLTYSSKLSDADMRSFMNTQSALVAGQTEAAQFTESDFSKVLDTDLKRNLPAEFAKDEPEAYGAIYYSASKDLEAFETGKSAKATQVEKNKIYNDAFQSYKEEGMIWGTNEISVESIKPERIAPLTDVLRATDTPVTVENITALNDDYDDNRSRYADMFSGAKYTESDLVMAWTLEKRIMQGYSELGMSVTRKQLNAKTKSFLSDIDQIDAALEATGQPITYDNRFNLFMLGQK
ncbi:MAG: hypothetical protein DRH76_08925 [Deltaproteobacteria bacterium]|nr:MAG: hypothetical protein DRH76_08925 [Deltaproteobacteria bacterium]